MTSHPGAPNPLTTPSRVFATAMDIVRDGTLQPDEKLLLLKRWEEEANDLQRAADESMTGSDNSRLPEIRSAIDKLVKEYALDEKAAGPAKPHA